MLNQLKSLNKLTLGYTTLLFQVLVFTYLCKNDLPKSKGFSPVSASRGFQTFHPLKNPVQKSAKLGKIEFFPFRSKFNLCSYNKKESKKLVFPNFSKTSLLKNRMSRAEPSFLAKSSSLKRAEPRLRGNTSI